MQTRKGLLALLVTVALVLVSCGGSSAGNEEKLANNADNLSTKERQYFANGKKNYATYCATCHMEQGQGLGKLIPPLQNSDYLLENVPAAARVIKYGLDGPIKVNGVEYNQPMPEMPNLTALEIAEITTYIYNNWTLKEGLVGVKRVEQVLETCSK